MREGGGYVCVVCARRGRVVGVRGLRCVRCGNVGVGGMGSRRVLWVRGGCVEARQVRRRDLRGDEGGEEKEGGKREREKGEKRERHDAVREEQISRGEVRRSRKYPGNRIEILEIYVKSRILEKRACVT